MAIYKIFPEKDATLYSAYPTQNTGLDEILEVSTTYLPNEPQVSRFLIKFSTEEILDVIDSKISGSVTDATGSLLTSSVDFQSNLKCYIAEIDGLSGETMLEVFPVAESWVMGTGKYLDSPKSENGCSWDYRESSGSNPWTTPGGEWYDGFIGGLSVKSSQSLSYSSDKDLNVDVTNTVKLFTSGTISNEGFIVKQDATSEFQPQKDKVANIKYFSIDTHTIYPPQLEFKWRDWTYANTSSYFIPSGSKEEIAAGSGSYSTIDTGSIIDTPQLVATLANNPQEFLRESTHKFYINCRPQYPERVFKTSSLYTENYYLPTSSYYAIKDLHTNEFIIDFDTDYTQISADLKGSYFKLYMNGLEPERYYKILIKTHIDGNVLILDDNYYFKIING